MLGMYAYVLARMLVVLLSNNTKNFKFVIFSPF